MASLEHVKAEVRRLAKQLDAPAYLLPTYDSPLGDATPFIEIVRGAFHFVVSERGTEFERRVTRDLDELLYWVFTGVTFELASTWEVAHRRPGEDSRRQLFARQEELLGSRSPAWAERCREEHAQVLREHPFRDH